MQAGAASAVLSDDHERGCGALVHPPSVWEAREKQAAGGENRTLHPPQYL